MKRISAKQEIELEKRRLLKYQLYLEQEGVCKKCGKYLSYYNKASDNYPHLSHKKSLARGGKTDRSNVEVICSGCHSKEHHLKNVYNEQPQWSKNG